MISPTANNIRAVLASIPPDGPRDEWVRVGMAVHSELGEGGFALWNEWSSGAQSYKASEARAVWAGFDIGGPIRVGTLFGIAKSHGFDPRTAAVQTFGPDEPKAVPLKKPDRSPDFRRRADSAARVANGMWASALQSGHSAYLDRKNVGGHGVRYLTDGTLLVPLRNGAGEIKNLQRIAPNRPPGGEPDKRFLPGGKMSGLWHLIGQAEEMPIVLIAEGYATGATLHEATGRPTAIAFTAGNLAHVARALRELLPDAVLLICGDDDQATESLTGKNPGRLEAAKAARAAGGKTGAVFPVGLEAGETDFNDLAARAGVEEVRRIVEDAAQSPVVPLPSAAPARQEPAPIDTVQTFGPEAHEKAEQPVAHPLPHGFDLKDGWLWFKDDSANGGGGAVKICTWLRVEALTVNSDGGDAGYLLSFHGVRGDLRQWVMPARLLAGDGTEYRAHLLSLGLRIAPGKAARERLTLYLQLCRPSELAQCVDRFGWHGRAFVLSRETLTPSIAAAGQPPERIVFQSENALENTFRTRGQACDWRDQVAALCVGNSRLVFAVCCALSGPLLRPVGMEGGGFHVRGGTSSGKTTALRVAASVWGGDNYLQSWRATDNAMEAVAAQHSDALLILDEIGEVDSRIVGACAYMLANGQGKGRMSSKAQLRTRSAWRIQFLSAGELGLAQHMSEGGGKVRGGQELRMAEIPADAGAGLGLFETLHGALNGAAFSRSLKSAAASAYGTAGRAWLLWCVENFDALRDRVKGMLDAVLAQWVPAGASEQVHRVAARFAVVAAAGELASEAGITGWEVGEATRAVYRCLSDWVATRTGGLGNSDQVVMVQALRKWLIANQDARLTPWMRDPTNDRAPRTIAAAGFRKDVVDALTDEVTGRIFFIQSDVFRDEICAGFDARALCRIGVHAGWLKPGADGEFARKERLPGLGNTRCYRISSEILNGDE